MATATNRHGGPRMRGGGRGTYFSAPSSGYWDYTNDSIYEVRKQYTSFEGGVSRKKSGGGQKKHNVEEFKAPPKGVETRFLLVHPSNLVCFSGRDHWLSTFFKSPMRIDGHVYPSVEHYYQACKLYMLGGARFSNQIRRISDAGAVKVTARRILKGIVSDEEVDNWKVLEGPRLLEYGMVHKFVQNPDLRTKLLDSGDALLVHSYDKDRVFAAGMKKEDVVKWAEEHKDSKLQIPVQLSAETMVYFPSIGAGKNVLGLIAMRVRDQIRHFVSASAAAVPSDIGNIDPIIAAAMAGLDIDKKQEGEKEEKKSPD